MEKLILVSISEKDTRVAILEDQKVVEFYTEGDGESSIAGNIYKGKIERYVPAVQAVFVDIGIPQRAFLETPERVSETEIIVQVTRDPVGDKGPRVTTNIAIPGRYLVLLPRTERIGVSRRIRGESERKRLKKIAEEIKREGFGIIVRTAAERAEKEDLLRDLEYILKVWERILEKAKKTKAPALLYRDLDMLPRILRDTFTPDVSKVIIDSPEGYRKALSFADSFLPSLSERIQLYRGSVPLFEKFGVERAVEEALSRKVELEGGGYIVIEETEALVSIDVNSGGFQKTKNLEDTALKVNLSAVKEIVRQLRLRDIGGIIVIDFIDMKREENRRRVLSALSEELSKDRAKTRIVGMSEIGLVEMTRKKVRKGLNRSLTVECPYCGGKGRIRPEDLSPSLRNHGKRYN